jgi:hypothetical protein
MNQECACCGCALQREVRVYCEDCATEHGVCPDCAAADQVEREAARV